MVSVIGLNEVTDAKALIAVRVGAVQHLRKLAPSMSVDRQTFASGDTQ